MKMNIPVRFIAVTVVLFAVSVPRITAEGKKGTHLTKAPASRIIDGKDMRQRAVITTDLECDDMNSLIHLSLFFNDVDIDGIVYSASEFHFVGDGVHTLKEITPDYICNSMILNGKQNPEAGEYKSYRPMESGWIENLWKNEYADAYTYLSQNDVDYPSPGYLESITKVGNIEFEGDVRNDTEGSDLIKDAILDDDPRILYIFSWGGFNTVARALLSISGEYKNTDAWQSMYKKICSKVIICGNGQDTTYNDYIAALYPDLKTMKVSDGYAAYFTALSGQADSRYTFQSEWLKKNIKFNHGALNGKYGLMGDGTIYKGETDENQFGRILTIDWHIPSFPPLTFNKYDFLAEGDSGGFMALIPVGLRGLENGSWGTWAGRISIATGPEAAEKMEDLYSGKTEKNVYNYVTGKMTNSTLRYLLTYQKEWAARADWCINDYTHCNHAPVVSLAANDFHAAPGDVINLNASVFDPDGNITDGYWWVDEYGSVYSGTSRNLQVWDPVSSQTSFTVPCDAAAGDIFCITFQVTDRAAVPMTRYAQAVVTVIEPTEK